MKRTEEAVVSIGKSRPSKVSGCTFHGVVSVSGKVVNIVVPFPKFLTSVPGLVSLWSAAREGSLGAVLRRSCTLGIVSAVMTMSTSPANSVVKNVTGDF